MLIYIVGFMGAGKSSVFKKLLEDPELPEVYQKQHFDFDEELARRNNIQSNELGPWIEAIGWKAFRTKETELLKETLNSQDGLYSLGGGAFHPINIQWIHSIPHATSIWVATPISTCWERVKDDANRPLVKKGRDSFFELFDERRPFYEKAKMTFKKSQDISGWRQISERI